jgi:hypothetical protein
VTQTRRFDQWQPNHNYTSKIKDMLDIARQSWYSRKLHHDLHAWTDTAVSLTYDDHLVLANSLICEENIFSSRLLRLRKV